MKSSYFYTRLGLGGFGPLCGTGVKSLINCISKPFDANVLIADSLPEPIPLTLIPTSFNPINLACSAINSETLDAAYGVPFLAPLNPMAPQEEDSMTFPPRSVSVAIVLLKVERIFKTPKSIFRFGSFDWDWLLAPPEAPSAFWITLFLP